MPPTHETHRASAVEDSAIDLHGYSTSGDEAVAGGDDCQGGFLEIPWKWLRDVVHNTSIPLAHSLGISQRFTRFTNLITCEHHSSWCANVAMFVSDAASFDTPALSFQTKRSRDEILDDLKRIMKLKPKARLGYPGLIGAVGFTSCG